ncbi:MAG: hypothetical protein GF311_18775 [Candidatus Lokiarchaeota archaeon]|nr:hypothetical protein [Candidatus Lokiarchaeota archaeon]
MKDTYKLSNEYWKLLIQEEEENQYCYKLLDKTNDIIYSDLDYHYSIITSRKRGSRFEYINFAETEKNAKKLESRTIKDNDISSITIKGKFENSAVQVKHVFELKEDDNWLNEYITLINKGNKRVRFGLINLGFEKMIFKQHRGWQDHLDEYYLAPIPSRRFYGYGTDRRKEFFTANDLLLNTWAAEEYKIPGFCAEGWIWANEENGLLVCKYNQSEIEFSRFNKYTYPLKGRGINDVSIIFGGSYLYNKDPENATELKPNQTYSFGVSKYTNFIGDYKKAYYLYRDHLDQNGHHFKIEYDPPVNWNELYNLGWEMEKIGFFVEGESFERYTLDQLYDEAEYAKDIGAECLYIDPGWNTYLGSEIWDKERFGNLKDFSNQIHEKYGLKLGLHLMMNFGSENELDYFYLISKKGVRVVSDPYINLYCVCANDKWVKEKTRRLLELAKNGVDFFMFDFTDFSSFLVDNFGCFCKDHDHEIPMKRQTHAEGILKVIQNIKKQYPNILIEAHQRGVNHPYYYQHDLPHSFDENWGFECMWNPLEDLLSHKAFQLYEYNMAYNIPLYLHINENSDNENMIQFWWYASVVRHLGIGGLKDKKDEKFKTLKQAMVLYKNIKTILTRGVFYGIDPMTHLHISEKKDKAVIITSNLSSKTISKFIKINFSLYNMKISSVIAFDGKNNKLDSKDYSFSPQKDGTLEISIEIPSLSPRILIFTNE